MVKFSYRVNGEIVEKEFNSYPEMILFVAQNNIKDEDFESLDMPGMNITGGIEGLKQEAITRSEEAIRQQEILELEDRAYTIQEDIANGADPEEYEAELAYIESRLNEFGIEFPTYDNEGYDNF